MRTAAAIQGVWLVGLLCSAAPLPRASAAPPGVVQVPLPKQQRPRLGAFLESDASGVWVRQVAPGSAAEQAGMQVGDRIVEMDGMAVQRAGQVIAGGATQPQGEQRDDLLALGRSPVCRRFVQARWRCQNPWRQASLS